MMSAIVRFAIRFYGVVIGMASLTVIYGLYTLSRTNLDVFPEFSPTQVIIQTETPGLSAERVEALVTQAVENSIAGTVGIDMMRSQSIPGLSVVTVIFKEGSDIYRNRQVVAERLAGLAGRLPRGITPDITPLTSSASTVLGAGITSTSRSLMELRTLVDWTIRPHLLAVRLAEVVRRQHDVPEAAPDHRADHGRLVGVRRDPGEPDRPGALQRLERSHVRLVQHRRRVADRREVVDIEVRETQALEVARQRRRDERGVHAGPEILRRPVAPQPVWQIGAAADGERLARPPAEHAGQHALVVLGGVLAGRVDVAQARVECGGHVGIVRPG